MTVAAPVRNVTEALAEVDRWKADEESRHKAELVEVQQEIKNLQTAIENLQQQLDALFKFKGELEEKAAALPNREVERAHKALFAALQAQSALLAEREGAVAAVSKQRKAQLIETLEGRGLGSKLEAFRMWPEIEPTLQNLPEAFRASMIATNKEVTDSLRQHVNELLSGAIEVDAPPLQAEIAWCVDAPEGTPELLVVVLPVTDQVHAGWLDREDGLQTWMAARVVQAIYEAAASTEFVRAQAICGGHMSLLAIEVDLDGAPEGFVAAFEERLGAVIGAATELAGAKLAVTSRSVHVDYILPPEEEPEESTDA